jgi:hypothetical protein
LDLAVERVHRGTASTKPRTATIVRSPDPGLRRFFELVASEGAATIFRRGADRLIRTIEHQRRRTIQTWH